MSHPRDDSDEPSSCPGSVVSAPHAIDRIEHEFTSTCHNDDDEGTHAVDLSAFEHQKENIQPRKQGRSARALAALCSSDPDALTRPSNARARALVPKPVPGPSPCEGDDAHEGTSSGSSSSGSCLPLIQQGHHDFQAAIAAMDPDTDDDPLDVHFRYTRWALEVRTQGGALPDLLQIFEKPLRLFRGQERYRNDTRYVKMWIWYTTIIKKGQEEVFKYLLANNVGDALAMFYEEYADLLEGRGKTALADEIYLLGINRKAQPLDRLRRRHENFQRRIIALEKR
ncbi:protein kinase, partial [Spiromyces aspiralis]